MYQRMGGEWGQIKGWASLKLEKIQRLHKKRRWLFECQVKERYPLKAVLEALLAEARANPSLHRAHPSLPPSDETHQYFILVVW